MYDVCCFVLIFNKVQLSQENLLKICSVEFNGNPFPGNLQVPR